VTKSPKAEHAGRDENMRHRAICSVFLYFITGSWADCYHYSTYKEDNHDCFSCWFVQNL